MNERTNERMNDESVNPGYVHAHKVDGLYQWNDPHIPPQTPSNRNLARAIPNALHMRSMHWHSVWQIYVTGRFSEQMTVNA